MTGRVHVVMPAGVRDPTRPSGGNAYDVRVCAGLAAAGWSVREHEVPGPWPTPDRPARVRLERVLSSLPDDDTVLVDGLVGSATPEALSTHAARVRLGLLVHMPLGHGLAEDSSVRRREEQALASAAVVVATSGWTRSWLLDAYRLEPERVRVAVPGADPAPVASGTPEGGRLVTVGPLSHGKGHDVLAVALGRLDRLEWRLDCVGSPAVDPGTAADLRRWAQSSAGRVRLLGTRVGPQLAAVYAAADLLVHPSRAETYGMVVTEALARGIPVLASDVGGTREALGVAGEGIPGLLVAPDDADALTAALRTWLTDDGERRRLRAAARVRRETMPSWDDTVAAVDSALRSPVLAGARS